MAKIMDKKIVLTLLLFAAEIIIFLLVTKRGYKEVKKEETTEIREKKENKREKPSLEILKDGENNFKSLLKEFSKNENALMVPLGFNEENNSKEINLNEIKNLLVVGTTGGGKSICLNEIISAILMNYTAEQIKILTLDTSLVELSIFNGTPHYLKSTIINPKEIVDELLTLQKQIKNEKYPEIPLLVVIDDLYDICSYDARILSTLEEMLENNMKKNIYFVVATDTPVQEVLTDRIRNAMGATLYLTLSPGEDQIFPYKKDLNKEEQEFFKTIGNAIYQEKEHKEKIKIPDISEEDIKEIKTYFSSF